MAGFGGDETGDRMHEWAGELAVPSPRHTKVHLGSSTSSTSSATTHATAAPTSISSSSSTVLRAEAERREKVEALRQQLGVEGQPAPRAPLGMRPRSNTAQGGAALELPDTPEGQQLSVSTLPLPYPHKAPSMNYTMVKDSSVRTAAFLSWDPAVEVDWADHRQAIRKALNTEHLDWESHQQAVRAALATPTRSEQPRESADFAVGQQVRVREGAHEAWQRGIVRRIDIKGQPVVRPEGLCGEYHWKHVEAV